MRKQPDAQERAATVLKYRNDMAVKFAASAVIMAETPHRDIVRRSFELADAMMCRISEDIAFGASDPQEVFDRFKIPTSLGGSTDG